MDRIVLGKKDTSSRRYMSSPASSPKAPKQKGIGSNLLSLGSCSIQALASSMPFVGKDFLTGLANGRKFRKESERIFAKLSDSDRVCSLLVVSIDAFENKAEWVGHAVAYDSVSLTGRLLTRTLRPGDLIGRVGKAKFAMCLPDEVQSDTESLGERLCRVVEGAVADLGVHVKCRSSVVTVEPAKVSFAEALNQLR